MHLLSLVKVKCLERLPRRIQLMRSISEVRRGKPHEMQGSMQRKLYPEYIMYASYSAQFCSELAAKFPMNIGGI